MTKLSLALILASVFSGGDSLLRTPVTQPEPLVSHQGQEIVIIRDSGIYAANVHLWPTLNNQDLAGLHNRQFLRFRLGPGKQTLGVRCFGGIISARWWHNSLSINTSPAQNTQANPTRYYRLQTQINGCAHIEELSPGEGAQLLVGAQRRDLGSISSCRNVSSAWFSDGIKAYCY